MDQSHPPPIILGTFATGQRRGSLVIWASEPLGTYAAGEGRK